MFDTIKSSWHILTLALLSVFLPNMVTRNNTEQEIENSVFKLLDDYFDKNQPFHALLNLSYDVCPAIWRHRKLLDQCHDLDDSEKLIYHRLLDILREYRSGKYTDNFIVLNDTLFNGSDLETIQKQQEELEQHITEQLLFVVQHRSFLRD